MVKIIHGWGGLENCGYDFFEAALYRINIHYTILYFLIV
jgi:hypothetical protein